MKLNIIVKPNSRKESVVENSDGSLTVRVNAPPIDGKANERVLEVLAEYFGKPKSAIKLLHGMAGKRKVFEILE